MNPKISVLMSVYNGQAYLKEAIDSILNQTFTDFEFVIINDASTDSSKQIIENYRDGRIILINNKENIGLTKSLNKGINIAEGKYIARMDADDISNLSRLEKQYNFLEGNPEYSIVGSNIQLIDKNGNNLEIAKYPEDYEEIMGYIFFANPMVHSSVMFKTEDAENIGGYNINHKKAQDYGFWFKFIEQGLKLYNIQEPLVKYRVHNESISIKNSEDQDKTAQRILIEAFSSILGIKIGKKESNYIRHASNLNPVQGYMLYNFICNANIAFRRKFPDLKLSQDIFAHHSINLLKDERYRSLFRKNIIDKYAKPN